VEDERFQVAAGPGCSPRLKVEARVAAESRPFDPLIL